MVSSVQGCAPAVNRHTIPVMLHAGKNSILAKISGRQWERGFYLWLTNMDGIPFEDLAFISSLSIQKSVEK